MQLNHLWAICQMCTCGHMSWLPVTSTAWPPAAATSEETSLLGLTRSWSFAEVFPDTPLIPVIKRQWHQWRTWNILTTFIMFHSCKNKTKIPLTVSHFSGWSLSGTDSSELSINAFLNLIGDFFLKKKNDNMFILCLQILYRDLMVLGLRFSTPL